MYLSAVCLSYRVVILSVSNLRLICTLASFHSSASIVAIFLLSTLALASIVDAVAAYELYGGPVLVIDFGTATTYDMVDENGTFMGGITAPGIRISAKALWEDAAKLPEIEIKKPDNILGKDTITSMQAGLVYGQIGQTEYIINKVKEETGMYDAKVVVTGGLGRIISNETENVDVYDPDLTLKGINLVYRKQNRKGVK